MSQGNELEREVNLYTNVLLNGVDLQFKRLGIYSLEHIGRRNQWQVHSEDYRCRHSQIYYSLKTAVEKFIELKYKLKRNNNRGHVKKSD